MQLRMEELKHLYNSADRDERNRLMNLVEEMNTLDSEAIVEKYLRPSYNPDIPDPNIPRDDPDIPKLLMLSPQKLIEKMVHLHSGSSFTLGLTDLDIEDVLEILYDCKGMITHLENFNLKDYVLKRNPHYSQINELQRAINDGNLIILKRIIRNVIDKLRQSDETSKINKFREILYNIELFQSYYKDHQLRSRVGSDSTGRSHHLYGMGLVIKDTLPPFAQREITHSPATSYLAVPVYTEVFMSVNYVPRIGTNSLLSALYRRMGRILRLTFVGKKRYKEWEMVKQSTRIGVEGNVVTLGGVDKEGLNPFSLNPPEMKRKALSISWLYMNSGLKNWIKVLGGFIPAFFTFFLTKDWWLLAYFGAFIWFGITGFRNIIQSVLGGGGIRRSPLLRWNNYVSWKRLTDSLFFTGFSVPLLDYITKTVILDRLFEITVATNPVMLYSVMAVVNGLYISTHNAFRGLQRSAILGNFFRTVISIPIALLFNIVVKGILLSFGIAGVDLILQKWAAIISKAASDCVAGVIEGLADRSENIRVRLRDYRSKLEQVFASYTRMEILFPESDVLEMLESPKRFIRTIKKEASDLEKIVIINALDLLYFWMYQPRAQSALQMVIKGMSYEERQIFIRTQTVLERNREISQLFVDGVVGKNFSKALSFYLDRSQEYLQIIKKIV